MPNVLRIKLQLITGTSMLTVTKHLPFAIIVKAQNNISYILHKYLLACIEQQSNSCTCGVVHFRFQRNFRKTVRLKTYVCKNARNWLIASLYTI